MMQSPGSSSPMSSVTTLSVMSPAGTITHTARGPGRASTKAARSVEPLAPVGDEDLHGGRPAVAHDAVMPVGHGTPDEVRTHAAEADHAEGDAVSRG